MMFSVVAFWGSRPSLLILHAAYYNDWTRDVTLLEHLNSSLHDSSSKSAAINKYFFVGCMPTLLFIDYTKLIESNFDLFEAANN